MALQRLSLLHFMFSLMLSQQACTQNREDLNLKLLFCLIDVIFNLVNFSQCYTSNQASNKQQVLIISTMMMYKINWFVVLVTEGFQWIFTLRHAHMWMNLLDLMVVFCQQKSFFVTPPPNAVKFYCHCLRRNVNSFCCIFLGL